MGPGIGPIRNYDKRGMILASKYREAASKLEKFSFEIGSTGSEIVSLRDPSARARVLPRKRAEVRMRARYTCAVHTHDTHIIDTMDP